MSKHEDREPSATSPVLPVPASSAIAAHGIEVHRHEEGLDDLLAVRGPLPLQQVVEITEQVGAALAAVHARNLVHRDIKPANILIEADGGRAVLLDLGIARDLASATVSSASASSRSASRSASASSRRAAAAAASAASSAAIAESQSSSSHCASNGSRQGQPAVAVCSVVLIVMVS